MYTIDDLNVRLLSELKEIAEDMGVKNAKKLAKQDLIYKILDQQAVAGESAAKTAPATQTETLSQDMPQNLNAKCVRADAKMSLLHRHHLQNLNRIFHRMRFWILLILILTVLLRHSIPNQTLEFLPSLKISLAGPNLAKIGHSSFARLSANLTAQLVMKACWRSCRMVMDFFGHLITIISLALMIFMFHRHKSNYLV